MNLKLLQRHILFTYIGIGALALSSLPLKSHAQVQELWNTVYQNQFYTTEDTTLIMTWIRKGALLRQQHPDSALAWHSKALYLSRLKYFHQGTALALQHIGFTYLFKKDHRSADQSFRHSLYYARKSGIKSILHGSYHNIGTHHLIVGNYPMAASYFDSALQTLKQNGPKSLAGAHNTLNNLAAIHLRLDQPAVALKYAEQAVHIATSKGKNQELITALGNKGAALSALGRYEETLNVLLEGLNLSKSQQIPSGELPISNSLAELMLKQGRPEDALRQLNYGAAQKTMDPASIYDIHTCYILGRIYLRQSDFNQAIPWLLKGTEAAFRKNFFDGLSEAYRDLASCYTELRDYEKALRYQSLHMRLKDSTFNQKKARDINDLEVKYRVSEKDRLLASKDKQLIQKKLDIAYSEARNKEKTTWIWISSLSTLFLVLLIILLRYRQKNKEFLLRQQKELDLLRATMEGEEAERIRVGKELHDGVSGFLSAIKMNLVTLRMQRNDIAQERAYTNTLSLADEAADELRKTAHNLVPSLLAKNGLSDAIKGFCRRLSHPQGINIKVRITGSAIRLAPDKELAIYRIVQELIHNILKHANATKVTLGISWLKEVLLLNIEDDGQGIPEKNNESGLGMDNIAKRIQSVNGSMEVDHSEEEGSAIYLYFPLPAEG